MGVYKHPKVIWMIILKNLFSSLFSLIFSNFVRCSFSLTWRSKRAKDTITPEEPKRIYVLFLFKKKQNQKKILYPLHPLLHKRGQPLLLVALTFRYARTIKGPAWVLYIIKYMANPEGAKAWEPYQNFDGGRILPRINLVLAKDWRGFRSGWSPS